MVEQEGPDTRNRTRELIRAYEYNNPDDAGLLDALDLAEESLGRLPESFSFAYRNAAWPNTKDGKNLAFIVFHEFWAWLGYVLYSTAYRTRWLLSDVWAGLDEREFLRTCLAARALLELAASLNEAHRKLSPALSLLRELSSGEMGDAGVAPLLDAHRILFEYVQATRFNWDAALSGDFETLVSSPDAERPATNVLTLLEKLPQDPKGIVGWHYKLLSDFVHPNMSSQLLPCNESSSLDEETIAFELSYHPPTTRAFDFALNAVAFPLNVSLASLTGQLSDISASHSLALKLKELFAPDASDFD
jgi:hypothetical protein